LSYRYDARRLIVDPDGGAAALQAWIQAQPASAMARLSRRGRPSRLPVRGLEAVSAYCVTGDAEAVHKWPPGPTGYLQEFAAAPAAALRADPVHLSPRSDHLVMAAARFPDMSDREAAALAGDLGRGLSGSGASLHRGSSGSWYLLTDPALDPALWGRWWAPEEVAGQHILEFMPGGPGCGRLNGWVTEIQMMLHDHPVNLRRAEAGLMPVNSIWPWGWPTGEARSEPPQIRSELLAADAYTLGLQKLAGGPAATASRGQACRDQLAILGAGPGESDGDYFQRIERDWLSPLLRDLRRGRIGRACIVSVDGRCVTASRMDLLKFWRRGIDHRDSDPDARHNRSGP
jgi:hypothetical protein